MISLRYVLTSVLALATICPSVRAAGEAEGPTVEMIDAALSQLNSPDPYHRAQGAMQLGSFGERAKKAIPRLVELLCDDEWEGNWDPSDQICTHSKHALQQMGRPAEEALIAELRRDEAEPRERAARLLGEMGVDRAAEPMLQTLRLSKVVQAWGVAEALGSLKCRDAVEPLTALLASSDARTRDAAAASLGRIGDVRSIEPLRALTIARSREPVATTAVHSLMMIEPGGVDAALALLRDDEPRVRRAAAEAIRLYQRPEVVDGLLAGLEDSEIDELAAFSLHWIVKERGVDPLLKAFSLKSAAGEVRRVALLEIGRSDYAEKGPLLIEGLADDDEQVRRQAAQAIADHRISQALDPLVAALRSSRDNDVRAVIVATISRLEDARAYEPLLGAMADETPLVRAAAAQALGRLKDARAVPTLLAALDDSGFDVRRSAAFALTAFDDPRAAPALIETLRRHSDETTRTDAACALGSIPGSEAAKALVTALKDDSRSVRDAALRSLAAHDAEESQKLIDQAFPADEASQWLQQIGEYRNYLQRRRQGAVSGD